MARPPFFVIPHRMVPVATSHAYAGFPPSNIFRLDAQGLTWRSNAGANGGVTSVTGNFQSPQTIDFFSCISANARSSTRVRLVLGNSQASVDVGSPAPLYDSDNLPFINPAIVRADGRYHSHVELPAPVTALWWKLIIMEHPGDWQQSGLILGRKIAPARFYDREFEFGVDDRGTLDWTRTGAPDGVPGVKLRTVNFTLSWLTQTELDLQVQPMIEALGQSEIVYCCFDPEPTAMRQARSYLGRFTKAPYARGRIKPGLFGAEFQILSII